MAKHLLASTFTTTATAASSAIMATIAWTSHDAIGTLGVSVSALFALALATVVASSVLRLRRSYSYAKALPSTQLHHHAHIDTNTTHKYLVDQCTYIHTQYSPPWWIRGGDLLTIMCIVFRNTPQLNYRREALKSPDGATLNLDWLDQPSDEDKAHNKRILLLLPGITGNGQSPYLTHLAKMAHESGWDVVTFVYPGTDLSPITSPRFLRSIDTHDIDLVTSHLRKLHPNATIGAVGWSMGGCMLVRHLGTHGTNTPVSFAVCASNPFSPARSRASLTRHRLIYNLHYMDSLRDMFKVNSKVFAEHLPDLDVERILKHRWVEDFDRDVTIRVMGYETPEAYYNDQGCDHLISNVQVPLLVVHAQDDPIVPMYCVPFDDIKSNQNIMLLLTEAGGHTGWQQGTHPTRVKGSSWFDDVALDWLTHAKDITIKQKAATNKKSSVKTTLFEAGFGLDEPTAAQARSNRRRHSTSSDR